ncbi:MAG: hypothetical protein J6D03_02615 [Clostridia bacterium]|nr:hypothetical protein [Clostridia bacterium]
MLIDNEIKQNIVKAIKNTIAFNSDEEKRKEEVLVNILKYMDNYEENANLIRYRDSQRKLIKSEVKKYDR